jgi:hypothetical protein
VSANIVIVGAVNRFTRMSETAQVSILAVLAAAVAGAPTLADLGKTWRLTGAVGGPLLVAVLALLNHFAQRQAKRLHISMETEPDPIVVQAFPHDGDVIEQWIANERAECLAPLAPPDPPEPPPDTPRARRGGFRAADVRDDPEQALAGDVRTPDTVDDPAAREASEQLTPAQRQIAASAANISATANAESVQVEVRLPGPVEAVDPDVERQPSENLPSRPKPFGKRTMSWEISGGPSLLGFTPPHVGFPGLSAGPDIDNTGSTHVTFPPFTLRPRSQVTLDPVHLVIRAEPGAVIDGTWTATATNAEGRAGGTLRVHVASAPDVVELLRGELGG